MPCKQGVSLVFETEVKPPQPPFLAAVAAQTVSTISENLTNLFVCQYHKNVQPVSAIRIENIKLSCSNHYTRDKTNVNEPVCVLSSNLTSI